jgi:hypothetical protein
MTMPMSLDRPDALIAPAVQDRLQFALQHRLDKRANMLAHPSFQRIEPVLAEQWHDAIQACILLHGVFSCGGGQTANVGSLYLQEITPPANFLPTKRHDLERSNSSVLASDWPSLNDIRERYEEVVCCERFVSA